MKLDTKTRLLDVAERLFAERGFAGTSVRRLVEAAEVDLGAVRYHFESKRGLFEGVLQRRLVPLRNQRLEAIERLQARPSASLEEVLEAFARPAFELLSHPGHRSSWRRLLTWARLEPDHWQAVDEQQDQDEFLPFIELLAQRLPGLSRADLHLRFAFLIGAELVALTDTESIAQYDPDALRLTEDPEGMLQRWVQFTAAGLRAPS